MRTPAKASLISPGADLFLLGGGSLLFTVLISLLNLSPQWIAENLGTLLFVFSYPHFMASYAVFYGAGGPWRKHAFVAIIGPALLFVALAFATFAVSDKWIHGIAHVTLILVFWHFLKQSFGAALWLGAVPGQPISHAKKEVLLGGLLLFGCYGYLATQVDSGSVQVFGTKLESLKIPEWSLVGARFGSYGFMLAFAAWLAVERWKGKNSGFSWQGWVPVAALATWLEPSMGGSPTRLILPLFHAIQYFPFPLRAQLNHGESARGPWQWASRLVPWLLVFFAGYVSFALIPRYGRLWVAGAPALRLFAFVQLFFNLHHYMIDAVIWKLSDPLVRARLRTPAN